MREGPEEIEKFNPGEFSYDWLVDDNAEVPVENEEFIYIEEAEKEAIDLRTDVDLLYLVKWKNLSYLEATWEKESQISNISKISEYRMCNRALDKESRMSLISQVKRHKTLVDIMNNPKKRLKMSSAFINELNNRLYLLDIGTTKKPMQYTPKTQPIYKGRRLLRDYQLNSLNWLINSWYQNRNVILADEMGLGKTIQTIALLNHLITFEGCKGPFLVIAPLSTLEHWRRTGDDWTNLNCILYYDSMSTLGRNA